MVLSDVVDPQYLHYIVVFTGRSEFKTDMPENVFRSKAWIEYVKRFDQQVISPMKLKRIKYRIEKEVLEPSWKTNRLHVEHLKQKEMEKKSTV